MPFVFSLPHEHSRLYPGRAATSLQYPPDDPLEHEEEEEEEEEEEAIPA